MIKKLVFLLFILISILSIYKLSAPTIKPPTPPNKSICDNCNIIFIGIDALQAAHVHHLGYDVDNTPTLDALAKEGFSFSQAISPSSWTVPTYMSIFTSTYPSVHKLVNRYVEFTKEKQKLSNIPELSPSLITIAEELKKAGYITGGFTGDAGVGSILGYNKGFDMYTDETRFGGFSNSERYALEWLDKNIGKKFFMFFHGYDTHGQFDIGKNYQSIYEPKNYNHAYKGTAQEQANLREEGLKYKFIYQLNQNDVKFWRAWYDGKIKDADERLSHFISELKSRNLLDNTIFIIFSDHGTEFYEHGRFDHGHTLYDELIRVPLIITIPKLPGGKIISSQISTLDIVPTALDILGLRPSKDFQSQIVGKSLVEYFNNPTLEGRDVFSETDYRAYTYKRAIRTHDGWKYILSLENGQEELYNLHQDPNEKDNLINIELSVADNLRMKIKNHIQNDLHANPSTQMKTGCLPAYPDQCK